MSGWQVGDLALCVDNKPRRNELGGMSNGESCPPLNSISRVEGLMDEVTNCGAVTGHLCLLLEGGKAGRVERFRKIKPDTEGANEDDAAWLKDLLAKPEVQVQP